MSNTSKSYFRFFFILTVILLTACSTKKNNFLNRSYHTVTAKYNIIFNGEEAYKEGIQLLKKDLKDNYTSILNIYPYPEKEKAMAVAPQMDRTIEKMSKAILKHSMLIKGIEYVKPIDNAYLLMGKSHFTKQEYTHAAQIFNYIANIHKTGDCYHEALTLQARSYIRNQHLDRAERILEDMRGLRMKPKDKILYEAASAELYLTKNDLEQAMESLEALLMLKPKKEMRMRAEFILGQIYETMENYTDASKMFLAVLKKNPSYEMEFNARMHLATAFDPQRTPKNAVLKELAKLMKDPKNAPYLDQIYYAYSEIARKSNDADAQKQNLALSVASYQDNNYQRTLSSLTLADLYFDAQKYQAAQAYYDTATLSMPKTYPNYAEIMKKTKTLTQLVGYLSTVHDQDSLLRLAAMPERQLNEHIDQVIRNIVKEEERLAKEEADRMMLAAQSAGMANINTNNSGKWYFYNQALITSGKTDFIRRFGNRKLEDNWFISNKQQILMEDLALQNNNNNSNEEEDAAVDEDGNPIAKKSTNNKTREFYKQNLPFTPEAKAAAHDSIATALFYAGLLYQDFLKNLKKSNETLEQLVTRYPQHELTQTALFLLYKNNLTANPALSKKYADIILEKYPDSEAAKIIRNPNYLASAIKEQKKHEQQYEETYLKFTEKQWLQVVELSDEALSDNQTEQALQIKYRYIRALALAQIYGQDSALVHMKEIVQHFPGTPIAKMAQIYVETLSGLPTASSEDSGLKKSTQEEPENFIFTIKDNAPHFIIIAYNIHEFNSTKLQKDLSEFHTKYFSLSNLNISNLVLDQNNQLITIAKFSDKNAAMDYYKFLKGENSIFSIADLIKLNIFAISSVNYTLYYNQPDKRASYVTFFEKNYIKK